MPGLCRRARPKSRALPAGAKIPTPPRQQARRRGFIVLRWTSVSQLIGPFLFTLTFAYFIGAGVPLKLPGAPFYLASALLLLALLIAARTLWDRRLRTATEPH